MWDWLIPPALMAGWFALFRWVLPALGVSTCLSGTCGTVPQVETPGRGAARDHQTERGASVSWTGKVPARRVRR